MQGFICLFLLEELMFQNSKINFCQDIFIQEY